MNSNFYKNLNVYTQTDYNQVMDLERYFIFEKKQVMADFKNNRVIKEFYKDLRNEPIYAFQWPQIIISFLLEAYNVSEKVFIKYNYILNKNNTYCNATNMILRSLLSSKYETDHFNHIINTFDIDYTDMQLLHLCDDPIDFENLIAHGAVLSNKLLDLEILRLSRSNKFNHRKLDLLLKHGLDINSCTMYDYRSDTEKQITKYLMDNGLKLDIEKLTKYKIWKNLGPDVNWKYLNINIKSASTWGNLDEFKKTELSDNDALTIISYMLSKIQEVDSWSDDETNSTRIDAIKKCIDYLENKYNILTSNYDIYIFMKNLRLSGLA